MTPFPSVDPQKASIDFDNADIQFELKGPNLIEDWLRKVINLESGNMSKLHYIFCSDMFLHDLNVTYLGHDTLTDVITFPIELDPIEGEVYISIERVRENASIHSFSFEQELKRVMVHGLLHLLGYGDKTASESKVMRHMEDKYLAMM